MKKSIVVIFSLVNFYHTGVGQISGYGSASYGQSTNPLYDYHRVSDQILQTYLEINSDHQVETSHLKFQYVGGSMIFHRFSLRNYYEHRLGAGFDKKLSSLSQPISVDSDDENQQDSAGTYFHTDVQITARHDKKEYQEFNNNGLLWNNALRINIESDLVVRVMNGTQYRYYQYLHPYQNISELVFVSIEKSTNTQFQYGGIVRAGLKYFPKITYDTSLFEETRSYVVQTFTDSILVGNGQQKHWQYFTYSDSSESDKTILKNPGTKSTYQIALGGYIQKNWNAASIRAEILYRVNSHSTLLTLVQNTSSRTLNEDLYNGAFSSQGPELHCMIKYLLPFNIQFSSTIDIEQNTFETPSYDLLSGGIINNHRTDVVANCEMYISKFFSVDDGFGFDVSISSNYLRNKSNDAYNNYSVFGFAISVGCGF